MSLVLRLLRGAAASVAILATTAALAFGCTSDTPAPPATEAPTSTVTAAPTPATTADRADGTTAQPTTTATPDRAAGGVAQPTATSTATATPSGEGGGGVSVAEPGRATLEALYDATGGADWLTDTNWLTDAPLGDWHGVTVDEEGRVTALELSGNRLTGRIPSPLSELTGLTALSLDGNWLWGPIPAELADLENLTTLSLSSNNLGGEIPPVLGGLSQLTELSLADNDLQGPIPAELGNLTNLTTLSLSENGLSGPIPPELGRLSQLTELSLGGNRLREGIPVELGSLTSLTRLSFESTDRSLKGRAAGLPESSAGVPAFAGRCRSAEPERGAVAQRGSGALRAPARGCARRARACWREPRTRAGAVSGRQAGSGSARNRARAAAHWPAQGQRFARCRVQRRAEWVSRPARAK